MDAKLVGERLWGVGYSQSQLTKLLITKEEKYLSEVITLSITSVGDDLAPHGSKREVTHHPRSNREKPSEYFRLMGSL